MPNVNAPEIKELRDSIYKCFGVNEDIIKDHYEEEQWNAFCEINNITLK